MSRLRLTLLTLTGLSAGLVLAQTSPITLTLTQALVRTVTVDGAATEQLMATPKTVVPGDIIRQQLTAINTSDRPVKGVVLKLPVPAQATYLTAERSESPGVVRTEFSADGGKTFALAPLKKSVTVTENGQPVRREVILPPSAYTNVRWTIDRLPPRAQATVGFRVQVK